MPTENQTRRYTRVLFNAKAAVQADTASLSGEVRNLCLNGMFICTAAGAKVKDREEVTVMIMIEGSASITNLRVKGVVIRHQAEGIAVQFITGALAMDTLALLKTVILSNGGDPAKVEAELQALLKRQAQKQAEQARP